MCLCVCACACTRISEFPVITDLASGPVNAAATNNIDFSPGIIKIYIVCRRRVADARDGCRDNNVYILRKVCECAYLSGTEIRT